MENIFLIRYFPKWTVFWYGGINISKLQNIKCAYAGHYFYGDRSQQSRHSSPEIHKIRAG